MVKIDHGWTGRLHPVHLSVTHVLMANPSIPSTRGNCRRKVFLFLYLTVGNGLSVADSMTSVTERYDDKSLDYVGWVAVRRRLSAQLISRHYSRVFNSYKRPIVMESIRSEYKGAAKRIAQTMNPHSSRHRNATNDGNSGSAIAGVMFTTAL